MEQMLPATIEQVLIGGDLSKLGAQDRLMYVKRVCDSLGLNPLTMPFQYINLNGKLVLYATKGATQQLAAIRGISFHSPVTAQVGDLYTISISCQDRDGRTDTEMAAVDTKGLSGERLANAMMKCMTKAKRRAVLSLCSLNMLDESEVETIPGARVEPLNVTPSPSRLTSAPSSATAPLGQKAAPKAVGSIPASRKVETAVLEDGTVVDNETGEILGGPTEAVQAIQEQWPGTTTVEPTEEAMRFYKLPWEMPGYDMKPVRQAIKQNYDGKEGYYYNKEMYMHCIPGDPSKISNFPFDHWEVDIEGKYLMERSTERDAFWKWKKGGGAKAPAPKPAAPKKDEVTYETDNLSDIPF